MVKKEDQYAAGIADGMPQSSPHAELRPGSCNRLPGLIAGSPLLSLLEDAPAWVRARNIDQRSTT